MKIEHIALWTKNIEKLRNFYITYFQAVSGPKYYNMANKYVSYFLSFSDGARIEIMSRPDINNKENNPMNIGYSHFAFKVGSIENVNKLTETLRTNEIIVLGEPRHTGDGYYESVILDPDGNKVELIA
jgi:lactoylglutathione lyase